MSGPLGSTAGASATVGAVTWPVASAAFELTRTPRSTSEAFELTRTSRSTIGVVVGHLVEDVRSA